MPEIRAAASRLASVLSRPDGGMDLDAAAEA